MGEELERGGVFEGVDGVFLVKADGEGLFEAVEVGEEATDEGGGGAAFEEERRFGVFGCEGGAFGEGAGGAGGFGFAEWGLSGLIERGRWEVSTDISRSIAVCQYGLH